MKAFLLKLQLFVTSVLINVLMGARIFFSRRRMSHDNGILVSGKARVVDNPQFPPIDIFEPGREFECRVRHGMASYDDDAKILVRGCSLKLANSRGKSPLDLMMNTGDTPLFYSVRSFVEFAKAFTASPSERSGDEYRGVNYIPYMQKNPACFVGMKSGIRVSPTSYSQMYYHSQVAQEYHARDGKRRYVKFRVIPGDRGAETGLPTEEELRTPWSEGRRFGDTRSRNYLKDEFRDRVSTQGVVYWLQLQLHEWREGDTEAVWDPRVRWDEATHPWMDVARIELSRVEPYEEDRLTYFAISHHPKSLSLVPAKSIDDPASLMYLRVMGEIPRKARMLGQKVFGFAEKVPDGYWGWPSPESDKIKEPPTLR
jgi:arachidonate 5-lipoxygenase